MAQALSALPNGALIKDTGSVYYGKPIIWCKIDTNHSGYPANSVTLITDKIIKLAGFDAREAGNANGGRVANGNNRYRTSNLRQWLNSTGAAGSWWVAQNLTDGVANTNNKDAKPTTAGSAGFNGYDTEKGFLGNFSAEFRAQLMDTTLIVAKNTETDGGGSETVVDKIFLASVTEMGFENENNIAEGVAFAYFTGDTSRIAQPTDEACTNSNFVTVPPVSPSNPWYWWNRTPYPPSADATRQVGASGMHNLSTACHGSGGVRPLCNLPSATLVSDTADSDGAYTIIFNQPPTTPGSITVPTTILAGTNVSISWGTSTDPEGAMGGYTLERSANGGTWTQIYSGTATSYTDSVAATGVTSVQYRVKAYDAVGLESDYKTSDTKTSDTKTVQSNNPPTISGSNSNLGTKTGAFTQSYTASDSDTGAVITVTEKIDSTQKRSYTATSGAGQTFSVTADDFIKLSNSSHTLTITATDQYGASVTRTYTFSRNESQIDVMFATPLAANAMPERIALTISRSIPVGATFQVLVCNNGNDTALAWEDATARVSAGLIYYFANTVKTAANWGVNVNVLVNRNGATGDCLISSIGGNFD